MENKAKGYSMTKTHDELGEILWCLAVQTITSEDIASAKTAIQKVVGECILITDWCECIGNCIHEDEIRGFNEAITTIRKALKKAGMLL